MLPVALAVLSCCVLPRCFALQKFGTDASERFERAEKADKATMRFAPAKTKWLSWWTQGSKTEWLPLYDIELGSDATAIVTHAGKNNQEYIDHAVMLGVSLKRHMPDYPRIALGVKGMSDTNQDLLEAAGWHVVLVADWAFWDDGKSGCLSAKACIDDKFILQQRDSMEKLNIFRLPIGRVLYLDADTYVASGELNSLLNGTGAHLVPEGNIGMVRNACNRVKSVGVNAPYSAGVMLFKPSLDKFKGMLAKVAETMVGNATRKNDEQIINEVYAKQATELDRKYNCMDPWDVQGADKCQKRCTEVVVSHFFGGPKPTLANETFLNFVRKPSGPFEKCSAMNHGSCNAWSDFYCDLVDNVHMLTLQLQRNVKRLGGCCHTPAQESDPAACHSVQEDCAETVSFNNIFKLNRSVNMQAQAPWFGNYSKTTTVRQGKRTLTPDSFAHGGRPVYAGPAGYYLFYALETKLWIVGQNIKSASAKSFADFKGSWVPAQYQFDYHMHTRCPELTKGWKIANVPELKAFQKVVKTKESTITVTDPHADEALRFESLTEYKRHKKYDIRRHKRFDELHRKHRNAKKRRAAKLLEDNATTAGEMIPQDKVTTDATISEDNATDKMIPEDKATGKETVLEDATTAGEAPKELEETEDTEKNLDAETPQVTTADETHTEDTTITREVPKEIEEVKGPIETKPDAETPQVTTAGGTATPDTALAGELPKEFEESKAGGFVAHGGQLEAGDELTMGEMSTAEAKAKCMELPGCVGFTMEATKDGADTGQTRKVWFKSNWKLGDNLAWTSWQKQASRLADAQPDAQPDAAPEEAQPAAQPVEVEKSASEFQMVLDRTTGRKLGMRVNKNDGVTLQITQVIGDLAEQWNDDHPEMAVYRGDSIVEVNGITNDALKLFEECKHDNMLRLVIKRGQADERATADTTTPVEMPKELSLGEVKGASEVTTAEATMDRNSEAEQRLKATKKQLEDSISALPDMPEVAEARQALQEQLDGVIARMATVKQ